MSDSKTRKAFGNFSTRPSSGLGSGKFSSFESDNKPIEGALVVPISEIVPNVFQVRQEFNQEALEELAADITERGILEPLIVRTTADNHYEIIAGERRYRAAQIAKLEEVPVIVKKMDDKQARFATLAENLQRQDLEPQDEHRFLIALQTEYNLSVRELAKMINRSIGYVSQMISGSYPTLQERSKIEQLPENSQTLQERSKIEQLSENSQAITDATSDASNPDSYITRPSKASLYNPKIYRRVAEFWNVALDTLKGQPDPVIKQQIREQIEDTRRKLSELEKQLEEAGNEE